MLLFEKEPYYQPKHKLITTSRPMGTLLIVVLREGMYQSGIAWNFKATHRRVLHAMISRGILKTSRSLIFKRYRR